MAPKKSKATAKPKAAPPPPVEEKEDPEAAERKRIFLQRRGAQKWATAQLESVRVQEKAAKDAKVDWLEKFHEFHEVQLIKIVKRLDEKTLDDVPMAAREQLATYMLQSAKGAGEVDEASFQPMADIWDWATAADGPKYERPPATSDETAAAELITQWKDTSVSGMESMIAVLQKHAGSASVHQDGVNQISALIQEATKNACFPEQRPKDDKNDAAVDVSGLTATLLVPVIEASMKSHSQDIMVLRSGYSALRGLAGVPKQMPVLCQLGGVRVAVEMLRKHFKDQELAAAANMCFYAMAKNVGKNSPELAELREAGAVDMLNEVMNHHAWNQALCGKVRVTLPFLTED